MLPRMRSSGARPCHFVRAGLALPALLLAALLAAACGARAAPEASARPPAEALPDFRLAAVAGGELGTKDLAGKVVVYDFWATWCGPCHIQAEILHALYPKVVDRGVEFVAVSVGEPEEVVREFLLERPYPYPVLVDPDDEISARLEILGLPTLIVVDREGRVVYRNTGIAGADEVERALAAAGAA